MKKFLYATILALAFSTSLVAQQPTKPPAPTKPAATDPKAVPPKPVPAAVTVWMQEYREAEALSNVITDRKKMHGIAQEEKDLNDKLQELQRTMPEGYQFDGKKDGLVESPQTDKTPKDISKSVPIPKK